ncbi:MULTISPECIES: DUF4124 domain-containing protein [Neisseria]|uniref:DUF4124 domain-containing protein n=1 Tax=Neisseria musculi TaxID=1815583 RepID=A0A7H1M8A2_9NEIS|nr:MULTISPECIES: DUF4124 domain-containing protein [Neisseria]MBF0804565.1 DUF4124 domain-containing protein [Neisseria sp. 19428wB4_WF04]QNT57867.1 hypothetical protein H7A79_1524 [Neisseria musculi]TFU40420.1 DUF4124 domain-containing protein [Neisseria sp. WF04]
MHITRTVYTAALLCLLPAQFAAAQIYTWKGKNGSTSYSDVPHNLKISNASTINVRTRTVTPPPAAQTAESAGEGSLADQQKQLNDAVSRENKKIEEQNKKIEEQNRLQKEDNCKTARLNRQFAETARVANRDEFIKRYDADIGKFCN